MAAMLAMAVLQAVAVTAGMALLATLIPLMVVMVVTVVLLATLAKAVRGGQPGRVDLAVLRVAMGPLGPCQLLAVTVEMAAQDLLHHSLVWQVARAVMAVPGVLVARMATAVTVVAVVSAVMVLQGPLVLLVVMVALAALVVMAVMVELSLVTEVTVAPVVLVARVGRAVTAQPAMVCQAVMVVMAATVVKVVLQPLVQRVRQVQVQLVETEDKVVNPPAALLAYQVELVDLRVAVLVVQVVLGELVAYEAWRTSAPQRLMPPLPGKSPPRWVFLYLKACYSLCFTFANKSWVCGVSSQSS